MYVLMLKSSHRPNGKVADALALVLARLHNCERHWRTLRLCGQLQRVSAAETFQSSHRPHGSLADMPKSTLVFQF